MNGRTPATPTNWTFILGTSGGVLVLAILFLQFFWFPWQKNKQDLERAEDEYDQQDRSFKRFMRERKKLETYRLLGLPRNLESGSTGYTQYLRNLMIIDCGFSETAVDIKPTGNEEKPKSAAAGGAKKPLHLVLGFQVEAKGTWLNVTKLLEKFQRTPFLHRIRTLTVNPTSRAANSRLAIAMNIEAMVVNKNELRPDNLWGIDPKLLAVDGALGMFGRPGGWAMLMRGQALLVPEMPKRRYADLAWVNPFQGGKPKSPYQEKSETVRNKEPGKKKTPPTLSEFRLVLTNPSHQRGMLLATKAGKNIVVWLAGPQEPNLVFTGGAAAAAPDVQAFTVTDGDDTVKGTVLRVDLREVYVLVKGKIYSIGFEKTLEDYLKRPLAAAELVKLGLVKGE